MAEYRGIRGRDALESIRLIGDPTVDVVIAPSSKIQVAGMMKMNEPYLVDRELEPDSPTMKVNCPENCRKCMELAPPAPSTPP
jgi:hypothetical protein